MVKVIATGMTRTVRILRGTDMMAWLPRRGNKRTKFLSGKAEGGRRQGRRRQGRRKTPRQTLGVILVVRRARVPLRRSTLLQESFLQFGRLPCFPPGLLFVFYPQPVYRVVILKGVRVLGRGGGGRERTPRRGERGRRGGRARRRGRVSRALRVPTQYPPLLPLKSVGGVTLLPCVYYSRLRGIKESVAFLG
jgi:hypothetical protein